MTQVEMLYKAGEKKFRELASKTTFEEFVDYLKNQPNFKVIELMDYCDLKELYRLSREEEC